MDSAWVRTPGKVWGKQPGSALDAGDDGQLPYGSPPPRSEGVPMSGSRIPGLVLPAVFLLTLVVGLCWYWRHRDDD